MVLIQTYLLSFGERVFSANGHLSFCMSVTLVISDTKVSDLLFQMIFHWFVNYLLCYFCSMYTALQRFALEWSPTEDVLLFSKTRYSYELHPFCGWCRDFRYTFFPSMFSIQSIFDAVSAAGEVKIEQLPAYHLRVHFLIILLSFSCVTFSH